MTVISFQIWIPIIVALISGGAVVRIIDYAFNQPSARQRYKHNEYDRLISELKRQDNEIKLLRNDIEAMRREQEEHWFEMNYLKTNWYEIKTVITAVATFMRVHTDVKYEDELVDMINAAVEISNRVPDHRLPDHKSN